MMRQDEEVQTGTVSCASMGSFWRVVLSERALLFVDVLSVELVNDGSCVSFPDKLAGRCALCSRVGLRVGLPGPHQRARSMTTTEHQS